jgi:hypothetical protein
VSINGELAIRIGTHTLAHACSYAYWANPYDDEAGDYFRVFAITDADGFAADVRRAMLNKREDGSSLLSDFIDKAMEAALDDGSEHVEYDQRIKHGAHAPSEASWAASAEPGCGREDPVVPRTSDDENATEMSLLCSRLRGLSQHWREAVDLPESEHLNVELVRTGKAYAYIQCADALDQILPDGSPRSLQQDNEIEETNTRVDGPS